jgi:hypothetical protein
MFAETTSPNLFPGKTWNSTTQQGPSVKKHFRKSVLCEVSIVEERTYT